MPGNVVLRDVTPSDLPVFFAHQSDADASRMAAFTPRNWNDFSAHWAKILADATVTNRTVVHDGSVAGNIVCWGASEKRLIGYWIGREYWNRGIATAALSLFLAEVPDRPLFAHVAKHNGGSIRVLEKCGFTRSHEDTVSVNGEDVEELVLRLDDDPSASQRVSGGDGSRL